MANFSSYVGFPSGLPSGLTNATSGDADLDITGAVCTLTTGDGTNENAGFYSPHTDNFDEVFFRIRAIPSGTGIFNLRCYAINDLGTVPSGITGMMMMAIRNSSTITDLDPPYTALRLYSVSSGADTMRTNHAVDFAATPWVRMLRDTNDTVIYTAPDSGANPGTWTELARRTHTSDIPSFTPADCGLYIVSPWLTGANFTEIEIEGLNGPTGSGGGGTTWGGMVSNQWNRIVRG